MADTNIDIKELTTNGLEDASGLLIRREYNMSIVKSRQIAESVIKAYAAEKNIPYSTFADTIEALFENGIINRTSRDAFHNIRVYGNKAVREADNDADDAQKAYYLLKNEVGTFMSRKTVSVDRTPVPVATRRPAVQSQNIEVDLDESRERRRRKRAQEDADNDFSVDTDTLKRPSGAKRKADVEGRPASSKRPSGNRSSKSGRNGGKKKGKKGARPSMAGSSFSIYDILRYLIPVIVVILLIIIIRSLIPSKKPVETTTAAIETVMEETTVQETLPPETEPETEPPVFEYRIKGDGINVRYADNQDRIYTQLSNGTAIGTVEPIDGSDFVSFTLDGIKVIVKKDFIEPIQ